MNRHKEYVGIDYFKFVAAFLVIAIHISPLATFTENGDFILTRIIARVAVPFYFMASGFFLISRYAYNTDKLRVFLKKMAVIYGISVLIYIPLNVYNHYFSMDSLLPNLMKDIFFDGTMYHLWYLPAAMIGAVIAWILVRKIGFHKAFGITILLYVVGVFGDSYYGVVCNIPTIQRIYNHMFELFDYTRNGIFFAPVFFVMGGMIADKADRISKKISVAGLSISALLMLAEGVALHMFDLQRHDSMYFALLPCMYFLFVLLVQPKGQRKEKLRTMALVIYIIHPMVIVAVRLVAKILKLQTILVENSLIHYLVVCIVSAAISLLFAKVLHRIKKKRKIDYVEKSRAWIEVDLDNLSHNVNTLNKVMSEKCELMAVVKAQAYGHGAYEVATHINRLGVKAFAVATIDEGIELRRYGITGEILILGYTAPMRAKELRKYDLIQTLIDYEYACALNEQGYYVKGHIKIDTGMHRLGFDCVDIQKIENIFSMKHIKVCGIFTHLCVSDSLAETEQNFTMTQVADFYKVITMLEKGGIAIPKIHIQSSYGLLNYSELKCNYARVGISLYGVSSAFNDETKLHIDLRPVLALKARVILLRDIRKGESVGYSRTFVAERDSRIAILPIGYADGFPRNLSCGKSYVLISGQKAPIEGRICMDQLAVDVTDILDVKVGMEATLIGKDGEKEITAPMVAENADSISNELLCRMGRRLEIVTV